MLIHIKFLKIILIATILLLSIGLSWYLTHSLSNKAHHPDPNIIEKAPLLHGKTPITLEQLQNKSLLIFYWATWCPFCLKEFPELITLQKELSKKGLQVIAVNVDTNHSKQIQMIIEKYQPNFPIIYGSLKDIPEYEKEGGLPVAYLFDKQGHFVSRIRGYQTLNTLRETVLRVLEQ